MEEEYNPQYVCPWIAGECVTPEKCAPALMMSAQMDNDELPPKCPILHGLNMVEGIAALIFPLLQTTGTKGRVTDEQLADRDLFIRECVQPDQMIPGGDR